MRHRPVAAASHGGSTTETIEAIRGRGPATRWAAAAAPILRAPVRLGGRAVKCVGPLLALVFATAAIQGPASAPDRPVKSAPAYLPTIGDITGQTQLRHFKLWFAGSLGNWDPARYEARQIVDSLDTAAKFDQTVGDAPFAQPVREGCAPPLADIGKAIAARSRTDFERAFERLKVACNACHGAAHVGFVKIRIPTSSPFSNQSRPPE
jgi:hypothetical protein